jgi:pyrroloquinoline quinone (PQQ) biosynthesis protein C
MLQPNTPPDSPTPPRVTTARRLRKHKQTKDSLAATQHQPWVAAMVKDLDPLWARVARAPVFEATATEVFPEVSWQRTIREFWCVVEAFPKYMGLTLAKTTFGKSPRDYLAREWLIGNIAIESMHAGWYIDWAAAHGISESDLTSHRPCPEVAALHEWLFSVAHRGSLAQAVGAINYAIEGTTGAWTKLVYTAFEARYAAVADPERAIAWLKAHAKYDDLHPIEALEIVKLASRPDEQAEVISGIQRSIELFARGLEWCHQHGA